MLRPPTFEQLKSELRGDTVVVELSSAQAAPAALTRLARVDGLSELGVECEVIDPRTIYPFDYDTVLASLAKTHRLVVVHESNRRSGIGGEIVSQVVERAFDLLLDPTSEAIKVVIEVG